MTTRRLSKVGEAVRETVSSAIVLHLRDPRVKNVTVLRAEVTSDLRWAKVFVSVMGPDNVKALTMKGLDAARGFLQAKVADRLQTKHTPVLNFVLDDLNSPAYQVQKILLELEAERVQKERAAARGEAVEDDGDEADSEDDIEIDDDSESAADEGVAESRQDAGDADGVEPIP